MTDFTKFGLSQGISSLTLDSYKKKSNANKILPYAGYINPTIIEERQLNVASMDVFSRLMMDRIIFLGDEIDDITSNVITAQLLYLSSADPDKDITLFINSPGGVVYDGLAIYDTMQYISNDKCKINTTCVGMAASMASILLCAGSEGCRSALPHSRVMIHQPMGGAHGQASDIEITANEIKKLKKELYDIISLHTGQDYKKILKDADRDHWMTAQEAKDYHMIDEVIGKR